MPVIRVFEVHGINEDVEDEILAEELEKIKNCSE